MAGRGARPHIKPPPKPFVEVPETSRIIKTGPDAIERRESELAQKWKELIAKEWTKKPQGLSTKTIWPDGSSFEGEVRNGKKEGYGIYIDQNGNFFQGVWKNDKKEGFFVIKYTNGEQFEGFFENDKRNGEGMHLYPDGSKFHGEYLNDMRHGRGCYWTRTEYYTLQKMFFRKYHYGTLIEEYEIYTSIQRDSDCPGTGFGTVIDGNGVKYEGDFVNYKRHGKGRLTFPDGSVFLGEFVDDKKQGIGMKKTKDGQYFYQIWKDDELLSETPTDALNYENFYWYDEGGFSSHN